MSFDDIRDNDGIAEGAFSGCTGITDLYGYYKLSDIDLIGDNAFNDTNIQNKAQALKNICSDNDKITQAQITRIFGTT